jgi:hypothetical protein
VGVFGADLGWKEVEQAEGEQAGGEQAEGEQAGGEQAEGEQCLQQNVRM